MIELGVIETRCFELFTGVGISNVALTGGYARAKEYYEGKFPGRSFDLDMERGMADYRSQGHSEALENDSIEHFHDPSTPKHNKGRKRLRRSIKRKEVRETMRYEDST